MTDVEVGCTQRTSQVCKYNDFKATIYYTDGEPESVHLDHPEWNRSMNIVILVPFLDVQETRDLTHLMNKVCEVIDRECSND